MHAHLEWVKDKLKDVILEPAKEGFRTGKLLPFKDLMQDSYEIKGGDTRNEN